MIHFGKVHFFMQIPVQHAFRIFHMFRKRKKKHFSDLAFRILCKVCEIAMETLF